MSYLTDSVASQDALDAWLLAHPNAIIHTLSTQTNIAPSGFFILYSDKTRPSHTARDIVGTESVTNNLDVL